MKLVVARIDADLRSGGMADISRSVANTMLAGGPSGFQRYYFTILENEDYFLDTTGFFHEFKARYSLQGIDGAYLLKLERSKAKILRMIKDDALVALYAMHFVQAELKHGDRVVRRDLGSFFGKLIHTFRPGHYCALDNPIKKYFGLQGEGFFVSWCVISRAYSQWARKHQGYLRSIRKSLKGADLNKVLDHDRLTDQKILDMIFWVKANRR